MRNVLQGKDNRLMISYTTFRGLTLSLYIELVKGKSAMVSFIRHNLFEHYI